jgi:hypothetical protein
MLCRDGDEFSMTDAVVAARQFAAAQQTTITLALEQVLTRLECCPQFVIVSGSGSFLARRVVAAGSRTCGAGTISLDSELAPAVAESACAFAVANLLVTRT